MDNLLGHRRGLRQFCGYYGCYSSRPTWYYIVWPIVGGIVLLGLFVWAYLYYRRRHRAYVARPQAPAYTYPANNQPVQGYPAYTPQPAGYGDYSTYSSAPGTSQGAPASNYKYPGSVEMPASYPTAQNQYYSPPPTRPQ